MKTNTPGQATLSWTPPGAAERRCTFAEVCEVGRAPENRILVASAGASRRHARLELHPGGLRLVNLSASNEVGIRDARAVPPGGSVALLVDDTFIVGGQAITLVALRPPEVWQRCANMSCGKQVASTHADCPWCGRSMAFALTDGVGG